MSKAAAHWGWLLRTAGGRGATLWILLRQRYLNLIKQIQSVRRLLHHINWKSLITAFLSSSIEGVARTLQLGKPTLCKCGCTWVSVESHVAPVWWEFSRVAVGVVPEKIQTTGEMSNCDNANTKLLWFCAFKKAQSDFVRYACGLGQHWEHSLTWRTYLVWHGFILLKETNSLYSGWSSI